MTERFRLVLLFATGAGVALSCAKHQANPPASVGSLNGTGGTHAGIAGRGSGASESGASGEGGANASSGGSTARTHHAGGASGDGSDEAGNGDITTSGGAPFTGDIGSDAGTMGNGGAPGPGDDSGHIFVGPGGYDGATGTQDDPFGTLAGAAAVAKSGHSIVLLDGNYTIPKGSAPVMIPDGVDVLAADARFASISGQGGALFEFAGSSHLAGLNFDGFATVAQSETNGAVLGVSSVTVTNCPSDSGKSVFEIGGGAALSMTDDATHDFGNCPAVGHVYDNGELSVDGELLHFTGNDETAVFIADDDGKLDLANLIATDGNLPLAVLNDNSVTTLATSTLQTLASHLVELHASASLTVTSSELSLGASAPTLDACVQTTDALDGSLSFTHSVLHDCTGALIGPAPKTLSVDTTEIYAMTESGLELTTGNASTITITGSSFHDDAMRAVHLGGGSPNSFALSVRGTQVANTPSGFELAGDAGSSWDFGTASAPGNNVLTASVTSLDIQGSAITLVSAVGNTWNPLVEDADASGQYAASSSPGVLEVTSGSGQNYTDNVGATLRLADNP